MPSSENIFIAHVRTSDGAKQALFDHLTGTAKLAKQLADKIKIHI